jgi:H+/Cl- antiporter ClcA
MCDKCTELDEKIDHYRRISRSITDQIINRTQRAPGRRSQGRRLLLASTSATALVGASVSLMTWIRGNGIAASILGLTRASKRVAPRRPLIRRARTSKSTGSGFQIGARRPITRHGAISATGWHGNTSCGNVASGCRRRYRSIMLCPCGARFDSHQPDESYAHRQHIYAKQQSDGIRR